MAVEGRGVVRHVSNATRQARSRRARTVARVLKVTLVRLAEAGIDIEALRDDAMELYLQASTAHSDPRCAGAGAVPTRLSLVELVRSPDITCARCLSTPPDPAVADELVRYRAAAAQLADLRRVLERSQAAHGQARWALAGRAELLRAALDDTVARSGGALTGLDAARSLLAHQLKQVRSLAGADEPDELLVRRYAALLVRLSTRRARVGQAGRFFLQVAAGASDMGASSCVEDEALRTWCLRQLERAAAGGKSPTQIVALDSPLRLSTTNDEIATGLLAVLGRWEAVAQGGPMTVVLVPEVVARWASRHRLRHAVYCIGPASAGDTPAHYATALELFDPEGGGTAASLAGALELARLLA